MRLLTEISKGFTSLHIAAANLHLRLFVFFEPSWSNRYIIELTELYLAAVAFLDHAFALSETGYSIKYATNYIMQMLLAAGFTLYRLLNSFFVSLVSEDDGKSYFRRAIQLIREMSLARNDLPMRLAEVLAQLWRAKASVSVSRSDDWNPGSSDIDASLQLKVRCRMSMSLVYDSVWRWRENFIAGDLDKALEHPTDLDDASTVGLANASDLGKQTTTADTRSEDTSLLTTNNSMQDTLHDVMLPVVDGYNVFDSLGWVLDGVVDFPFQDVISSDNLTYP